ncbi:Regulator of G-protein signaling 20 [Porites harrisoni]
MADDLASFIESQKRKLEKERAEILRAQESEVSIDHKTRQTIEEVMEEPDQTVYDHAQRHVYYVMYQDCYPRFLVSKCIQGIFDE